MPIQRIPGTDIEYFLILFDETGQERFEADGTRLSDLIRARLAGQTEPVTDVFVASHGWQGDVPAAIAQYDDWIGAMAACDADRRDMARRRAGFHPLLIGLHWPSLPWGIEDFVPDDAGVLSADHDADARALALQLNDRPETLAAICRILDYADTAGTLKLPPSIEADFAAVFDASGLRTGSAAGRPGADQDGFDPQEILTQSASSEAAVGSGQTTQVLGVGDAIRDAILAPLRQLSFSKMKDRARMFGETGAHALLNAMQDAGPRAHFHLMGHSFGCIVVSGMIAGGSGMPRLRRPVDSLFLVQGALSLWAYAKDVPYAPGTPGYFRRILEQDLVQGPLVTTRSKHDTALGKFYPLGVTVKGEFLLGDELPKYGGIGAFGIQGESATVNMLIAQAYIPYDFSEGRVFNLEASEVIKNGSGLSGAHSDIAHSEVAHAFWAAAIASIANQASIRSAGTRSWEAPTDFSGGLLGGDDPPASLPTAPMPTSAPARDATQEPSRWINAEFDELHADATLERGEWYTLAFDVDLMQRSTASAAKPIQTRELFGPDDRQIVLTVQIDTEDFDVSGHIGQIRLPRTGKSVTKARFDVSPLKSGPCCMKATILKDGQFIQQIDLTFTVGQPGTTAEVATRGRSMDSIAVLQPRDLSLQIRPSPENDYECVMCGAVATCVRLPITRERLESAVMSARAELLSVVMQRDTQGRYPFQCGIDIPEQANQTALQVMARAGALLMRRLFEGPGAGEDVRAMGKVLRRLATSPRRPLRIQIVAKTMPIPWSILYMGDASGDVPLDWNNFLGMRHIVEHMPFQNPMTVTDPEIVSNAPQLSVSLNVDPNIDIQFNGDFVKSQQAYWADRAARSGLQVTARTTSDALVTALRDAQTPDQILYFYCHAVSRGLTEPGGPGASSLALIGKSLTLDDLSLRTQREAPLAGNPLVFINACESAEMSPMFYDGFVPYFIDQGARGVIGTECKTPVLFAREWAERFFDRFLAGMPLGSTVLELRREFLERHRNPLGLLYAMYCDADTMILPGLR
ncbi:CHAT domain-containing protein [Cupriavidus sp. YR651]|uniref:CHAT domain-containing protein n=1 Tax=Cupriavidus sp. YR651 TaxID=1855315 RepID=UPI000889322F|nr:CHAT domain-containing protein [Cupriavidus sp. YR651]SDD63964.1 CHAT domain-containing protein [Cupriavidus sp. YR651]